MRAVIVPRPAAPSASAPAPRVAVAGGFTGGHITCAHAIADAIVRRWPAAEILMVGSDGGPEVEAARAAGWAIATVPIRGIDRRGGARAMAKNLALPVVVLAATRRARALLARFRADAVVGVGGYPSFPIVAAAQLAGLPTLVHEANVLPGIANRLLARGARVVCVGRDEAVGRLAGARVVVTGTPARRLPALLPAAGRARLGLAPDRRTLLVTGGSLGLAALNRWVVGHQHRFGELGVEVLLQAGREGLAAAEAGLVAGTPVRAVALIDDMAAAYGAADLVVTAGGALTLAELAALGKPAIFVPRAEAAEGHQMHNLVPLERRGLEVCPSDRVDAQLFERVAALLGDETRRRALGTRLAELARPDAADRIALELDRMIFA
jgi:UDP-N-acetylglucosamine--N-acetylmuramyl-(pentapeptide) pyrophosphoryl-undecaprenol N-acetylglucosamine transferase